MSRLHNIDPDPNIEWMIYWSLNGKQYQIWAMGKQEVLQKIAEVERDGGSVTSVQKLD
ncbi:MAG: hypothetical protein GF334_05770 [Candidatus Altiarchaeales archaeon]|nr:hypothetical protein [Candidatus Altiarchaeales archaeon]